MKRNIVANYLGQGWSGLIGIAFVPLYIRYLGIEAYGLIGIFALLQAWLTLLDMGMTPTLNREMARFTAGKHTPQSIRDLLRSLEIIFFGIAVLIGILIWAASGWLASDWLRTVKLSAEETAQAINIIGIVVALRFLEGIYRGAILGLQKQVFFNVVNSFFATLRAIGAVAVLVWISPTIKAYFLWQGVVSLISVGVFAAVAHKYLPITIEPSKFSRQALINIRRFAGGMMATTFLALLLTQIDKVLLSRILSLEAFGYYTLAATVAAAIMLLVSPIAQAFYPRFTELVAREDITGLAHNYHFSAQLVTVLAAPGALMLAVFGRDLVELWTNDAKLAEQVAPLLALLAIGTLLNGIMQIPYMLQLAHGWSSLTLKLSLVAVTILVPAILWATPRYGAIGAAWAWVVLNAGHILIGVHFMYRRLLPTEKWRWYWGDVVLPLAAATLTAGFFHVVVLYLFKMPAELEFFVIAGLSMVGCSILAAPELRQYIICAVTRGKNTNDRRFD